MDTQTTAPQTTADRTQGQDTAGAVKNVAATASQEAGRTTREATDQARQLWSQARTELTDQAGTQQARAASGLHDLAQQLGSMAQQSDQDGMARSLVEDVARRAGDAAAWLDQRDPGTLLQDVRDVARRRPGTFLAVAAGLGVIAGRMSRGLVDEQHSGGTQSPTAGSTATPVSSAMASPAGAGAMETAGTTGQVPVGDGVRRTSQPIAPDGTPTPIDSEGRLGVPDLPSGGPR
jgi:hypothetical protein